MMVWSLVALALAAASAPLLVRAAPRLSGLVLAAVPFGLGCWYASSLPGVTGGASRHEAWSWLPDLGAALSFRLDGLSLTFAMLICFIGSVVVLYASSYLASHPRRGSFLATLLSFMVAMLGLVLADNLILLFVFWELTSVTSFMLIGFDFARESARKAALQALLVTGLGGLALLAGLVLAGVAAGGFEIGDVLSVDLREHGLFTPAVVLILLGAFTKSAIFPFHFWLPNAMEAPSPVSALLHSATMVKAGVYLVARLHPAFEGAAIWDLTLTVFGAATMLGAAVLATRQDQLKRILAYSTVSSLGTLVMFIGMGAAKAAATYLLAHALFKGCLFLVAGSVTKQTGRKDPEKLGGLLRVMPVLAVAGVLGALSMAGMFPLIGFVGKELLLKAGLSHPEWAGAVTAVTVASAVLTVMAALLVGARPFFGARAEGLAEAGEPDWRQLAGPVLLAGAGVVAGLAPWVFAEPLVGGMIASISGESPSEAVRLRWLEMVWPVKLPLVLSLGALAGGFVLYAARGWYRSAGARLGWLGRVGPARWYEWSLAGLFGAASGQTRVLQNGSLQAYVRVTLLVSFAAGVAALIRTEMFRGVAVSLAGVPALEWVLVAALVVGAVAATLQRSALASVAVLGCIGFSIALLFALYGAPDVAMTQFAVETLVVIIFVLVIFHLPRYSMLTGRLRRLSDGLVAGSVGLLFGLLTLGVMMRPAVESVSSFYTERSVTEAYGRNVVNVILVDFRALDTLGEIFVICIAALGVYTLLRLRAETKGGGG
ncbi:MAG: hydrogen gas-evolving membrane-bound hydrogenase subunit E [Phycisphaerales bacterium]